MMTLYGDYVGRSEGAPSIEAIALGLSRMPRFGGQTLFRWTVADHSVVCMRLTDALLTTGLWVDPRDRSMIPLALHVLLHDAHEALTGDIPTTFKTPDMKELQRQLDTRIYHRLCLPFPTKSERGVIASVDNAMLLAEARVCTPPPTYERIALDHCRAALSLSVRTVEQYLHEDRDPQEAFLDAYHNAHVPAGAL